MEVYTEKKKKTKCCGICLYSPGMLVNHTIISGIIINLADTHTKKREY